MRHGVYVDLPIEEIRKNIDRIQQLPVQQFLVMIETPKGVRKYTTREARELADLLTQHWGYNAPMIVPVIWPSQKTLNRGYFDWVHSIMQAFRTSRVRADLELQWKGILVGSAQRLIHELNPEVTTLYGHRESSKQGLVGPYAETLEIQAYSTRTMLKQDDRARPGQWQAMCFQDGLETNGKPPALALAAYHQVGIQDPFGGLLEPEKAMEVAYLAAKDLKTPEVNWWSLRHILSLPYAWRFMTGTLPSLQG